YLTKPFQPRELLAHVNNLLRVRRVEAELRHAEAQYRSLIATIPDVVWTFDAAGRPLYVSPSVEPLTGLTPDAICVGGSRTWLRCVHRDDVGHVIMAFRALVAADEPYDIEFRFRRNDGQWVWLQNRGVKARDVRGAVVVNGVTSDVTSRHRVS